MSCNETSKNQNTKFAEDAIKSAKKLTLTVIDGGTIPKGTSFLINAGGYINSQRNIQDGIVYFGCTDKNAHPGDPKTNDIEFTPEESGFSPKQCEIYYVVEEDEYYIKDLGDSTGTFIRIDNKTVIYKQMNIII